MTRIKIILSLLIIISFSCCKKQENPIDYESKVLDEIFLSVVDSTYKDGRIYLTDFPEGTDLETRISIIEKDTSKMVFAVSLDKYKLDVSNYNNGKFVFKNISEFPQKDKYEIWETKYDFGFAGVLYFSNLKIDNKKENGTLDAGFGCGTKCGWNYKVFIKKTRNKWKVTAVKVTSMS